MKTLKATSGILLTLFVIGMLVFAFNIQPVKADETSETILYSVDHNLNLVAINSVTLDVNIIGYVGYCVEALYFSPEGTLFATADLYHPRLYGAAFALITIDRATGTPTIVGYIGSIDIEGIAFGPDGTLYGIEARRNLIRIDPETATSTVIGNAGCSKFISTLAFSPDGVLYGVSLPLSGGEGTLLKIDTSTGSASAIGRIGFNMIIDIAFTQEGTLYGVSIYFGGGTGELITIDPSTGAGSAIGKIGEGEFQGLVAFPEEVEAIVDIDPGTLNLKSKGKWITAYIELPEGYNVNEIDISTVKLNGEILAESHPTDIGDYDTDDITDMMVKFSRQDVIALLSVGEAALTITGQVNDTLFEGTDTIRVIGK